MAMAIGSMKEYLTASEVAEMLSITRGRVSQLLAAGELRAIKFGNQLVFHRKDIEEFEKRRRGPGRPRNTD